MRSHAAGASSPSFTASRAAIAMPTATASPWIISREHFSTAWPNVWPRLSFRRSPCSRSSRLTTAALSRTECTTTLSMASGSAHRPSSPTRSISPKSGSSPMIPALTASASPARISRRGSVAKSDVSQTTNCGWAKTPAMFLYPSRLTPFLPPTLASTHPSSVVETNPNGTPRM